MLIGNERDMRTLKEKFIDKLKDGKAFTLRNCSICCAPLTYFSDGESLYFDSNCDCSSYRSPPDQEDWSGVGLDFYFDPKHGHLERIEEWVGND